MASIEFHPDFKDFLRLLNSHGVEYLVVGGYAVGYHGYPRATGDLDIWIAVSEANAERAAHLLAELKREVTVGHSLYEAPVDVIACSGAADDVLLRYREQPQRFAVVHLTWIGGAEVDLRFPSVEFEGTFDGFIAAYK